MAEINKESVDHIRGDLQNAAVRCSERCLYQSAKWSVAMRIRSVPSTCFKCPDHRSLGLPRCHCRCQISPTPIPVLPCKISTPKPIRGRLPIPRNPTRKKIVKRLKSLPGIFWPSLILTVENLTGALPSSYRPSFHEARLRKYLPTGRVLPHHSP